MSWAAKPIKINIYTIDHEKADTLKLTDFVTEQLHQTQMSPPAPVVDVADNIAGTNQWIGNFLLFLKF